MARMHCLVCTFVLILCLIIAAIACCALGRQFYCEFKIGTKTDSVITNEVDWGIGNWKKFIKYEGKFSYKYVSFALQILAAVLFWCQLCFKTKKPKVGIMITVCILLLEAAIFEAYSAALFGNVDEFIRIFVRERKENPLIRVGPAVIGMTYFDTFIGLVDQQMSNKTTPPPVLDVNATAPIIYANEATCFIGTWIASALILFFACIISVGYLLVLKHDPVAPEPEAEADATVAAGSTAPDKNELYGFYVTPLFGGPQAPSGP